MRLTCRPPERTKAKHTEFHHHRMTAIPTSLTPTLPLPPPSVLMTSTDSSPTPPQFFSAPPVKSYVSSPPPPPPSVPSQNDILRRIVKADDGIKKKKKKDNRHKFKSDIVPAPPLSRYKRPAPIVPNRPGDRYPLGIPYEHDLTTLMDRGLCAREDCAQNSKASVSRHCISEYVQKGARGSCIPKQYRVEWCNTCYMTYCLSSSLLTVVTVATQIISLVSFPSSWISWRYAQKKTTSITSSPYTMTSRS